MNNSHIIYTKFMGPTNFKGPRIKLFTYDLERNVKKSLTFNYDYVVGDITKQAQKIIEAAGLKISALNCTHPDHYAHVCEWDFEKVAALFKFEEK